MNNNFFIFVLIVVFLLYAYASMGKGLLTAEMARQMLQSRDITTVIDVRTQTEWNLGHYKGALHIPTRQITTSKLSGISRSSGILVYCNTGQRARAAAEKIRKLGYENVYYIRGGYWTLLKS